MKLRSIKEAKIKNKPAQVLVKSPASKDFEVSRNLESDKILAGKKVLLRVDFNVPLKQGKVVDNSRIKAVLPTIQYLSKNKAKVILISHLGKPDGKKNKKFSLEPIAKYLKVKFFDDCVGNVVKREIETMKPGEIILLENLRFYPQEEQNDAKFAQQLADLVDIYINEAFSVSHREHASVCAITKYLPSYAGFLLEEEIKKLTEILNEPKHPFIAIVGGAKISTKIKVISNLLKKVDYLLIGGALANNFFKVQGNEVGKSLIEEKMSGEAKKLLKEKKIILPIDAMIENQKFYPERSRGTKIKNQNDTLLTGRQELKIKNINDVKKDEKILDVGPKTVVLFSNYLKKAKMIVWNGPMGMFEEKGFDKGTMGVAKAVLENKKAKIIIGGGETIAAIKAVKNRNKNVFISTGGGAMLKFLEGKTLPGIKPLMK